MAFWELSEFTLTYNQRWATEWGNSNWQRLHGGNLEASCYRQPGLEACAGATISTGGGLFPEWCL